MESSGRPPSYVGDRLGEERRQAPTRGADRAPVLVRRLLAKKQHFGITRLGSITRLDRIGIPVSQAIRPLALSNAVVQGKGPDPFRAAGSALMEALEMWAAENIAPCRVRTGTPGEIGRGSNELYTGMARETDDVGWGSASLSWIDGFDLLGSAIRPVPLALVDTVYTVPSPHHPSIFDRITTGLGAGTSLTGAIFHAGLEILERDALAGAHRIPHFFDRYSVDPGGISAGLAGRLLGQVHAAGFLVGLWRVPAPHDLPVYWCHVMDSGDHDDFVPFPADGSACRLDHGAAIAEALMEACQGRLAAISGAREDITRADYPTAFDHARLAEWRETLGAPAAIEAPLVEEGIAEEPSSALEAVVEALRSAGARAVLAVVLHADEEAELFVVRVVAPPLRAVPAARRTANP